MEASNTAARAKADLEPRLWVKFVIAMLVCGVTLGVVSRLGNSTALTVSAKSSQEGKADPVGREVLTSGMGTLRSLSVAVGEHVAAGQVIAELEAKPFEQQAAVAKARLAQTEAELQHAEATFTSLQRELPLRIRLAEAALAEAKATRASAEAAALRAESEIAALIAEAKAGVDAARIARDFAKKELDRFAVLPPDEAATLRRSQEATRAFALSIASLKQAEAKLVSVEAGQGRIDADKKQALEAAAGEARASVELEVAKSAKSDRLAEGKLAVAARKLAVEEARSSLAIAESARANAMLRSPTSGVVVRLLRKPGESVAPGTPLLVLRGD